MIKRVSCYIDGFNLWHAIKDIKEPDLQFIDFYKLFEEFIDPKFQTITNIYYFSAYSTWIADEYSKQVAYIKALEFLGVTPIMGRFKKKTKHCSTCGTLYHEREEKETDVNIAVALISGAYKDEYDEAFLISTDSDLSPALRQIKLDFPQKSIKIIAPLNRKHSKELVKASCCENLASIKREHLIRSHIPQTIKTKETP